MCRLGIPDALSDDPASAASATSLANRLSCSAPCLVRLLRLCTAYGLLVEVHGPQQGRQHEEPIRNGHYYYARISFSYGSASAMEQADAGALDAEGEAPPFSASGRDCDESREESSCFYLTDTGVMLQESHPSQMKWLALMLGLPGHYVSRGHLYDNVKKGKMGFEAAFGCDWYSYVAQHPLESTAFDRAMTATSTATAQAVAKAYDFSQHETVMDVGGGQGLLMTAILHHHPDVRRGYVLELPQVVVAARQLGQRGLERLEYVEGDFFQPFPRSAHCIVMRLVLHDWPDREAVAILRHARAALDPGPASRLLVVEAVLPELVPPGADSATVQQLEFDMGMMLMTPGRERSRQEWEMLFRSAGFRLLQVLAPACAKAPVMVVGLNPESAAV